MWRLGHRPALDGLRGLAVLLVVAFHIAGPSFPAGGVVGVTVFFALSGFLITSLMLEESDRAERVNLRRFYAKRALRLLPALAVMLPIAGLIGMAWGTTTLGGIGAVALYSSNAYAATGHGLGILQHMWTLSVEEQFYLIWPLLIGLVARSRRAFGILAGVAVGVACVRLALMLAGVGEAVLYYTSGEALIAGAALAFWVRRGRSWHPQPFVLPLLLAAMFAACWMPWTAAIKTTVAGTIAVPLVAAIASGARSRLLEWRPVREVGRRSYGLYLWHLPAVQVAWVVGANAGLTYWQSMPFAVLLMAALTQASWVWVEQPFLRMKDRLPDAEPVKRTPSGVRGEVGNEHAQLVGRSREGRREVAR